MNNSSINSIAINGNASGVSTGGSVLNQSAIGSFVINSGATEGATSGSSLTLAKIKIDLAWSIQIFVYEEKFYNFLNSIYIFVYEEKFYNLLNSIDADNHFDIFFPYAWRQKVTMARKDQEQTIAGQGTVVSTINLSGDL